MGARCWLEKLPYCCSRRICHQGTSIPPDPLVIRVERAKREFRGEEIVDLKETFLRGELVFDGNLLKVHRDVVSLVDGSERIREIIRHSGAAVIVPHLRDGRYVLVRQYRYAMGRETLEFPAGRLDPHEDPLSCARRELAEETGYAAERWERLFNMHPAPGYSDEELVIFMADDLRPGEAHADPDEPLEVIEATHKELLNLLKQGKITDSKTVAAILYLEAFGHDS